MSILRRKGASWIIAYIVSVKKYKNKTNNILLITLVSIKGSENQNRSFFNTNNSYKNSYKKEVVMRNRDPT